MNDYEYHTLRQRAIERDMTDVCKDLGIELSTRGKWRECHCPSPQHIDHHPSCHVNVQTNSFKCFSCGCGGNNINLVRMVRGCSYIEAIRFILGDHTFILPNNKQSVAAPESPVQDNLDLPWLRNLVSPREYYRCLAPWAIDFLHKRRIDSNLIDAKAIVSIDNEVATQWGKRISSKGNPYTPKFPAPSLLFPYRDEDDIIINLQARLDKPKEKQGRFHFPPGSHTSLWNPRDALTLSDGSDLWIAEGVTDALALITSGRPALAVASATSLTQAAKEFIARQATRLRIHIYPDNDGPGQRLYEQLLPACPALRRHSLPDGCKDFGQAWAAGAFNTL